MLVNCGYVGPVQPPSPEIPTPVTDLAALERDNKIIFTFTTPPRTNDGVAITKFSEIDLRVGPQNQTPDNAKSYDLEPPPPSDKEDPQPKPMVYSIDVGDWIGQRISASVRTAVKKSGHFSSWSNRATLTVIPPLPRPSVHAEGSAKGIVLTWPASDATQFRVQRQGPNDKTLLEIANVNENKYLDTSSQYDTEYHYIVTAKKDSAESLPSETITINIPDKYPPAVPTGVTALAGPDSIEVAWQRDTEPDLQGYYVYRSVGSGPYQRLPDLVGLPTYTDHNVEHGKTYSYKISAIDKKGNASAQSSAVEIQF